MNGAWIPFKTPLCEVWGVPVSLSRHYRGLSICLHNRDVYNHTSDALLPSPLHTHSCQLSITGEGDGGGDTMTTYRMAPWLNIAKPLWLLQNRTSLANRRLVSFPCLATGGRVTFPSPPRGGAVELCLLQVWRTLVDSALHWRFKLNIKHWGKWEERSRTTTGVEELERRRDSIHEMSTFFIKFDITQWADDSFYMRDVLFRQTMNIWRLETFYQQPLLYCKYMGSQLGLIKNAARLPAQKWKCNAPITMFNQSIKHGKEGVWVKMLRLWSLMRHVRDFVKG